MAERKEDKKSPQESSFQTAALSDFSVDSVNPIGPYTLLSVLGEGGFGIVYLAEQKYPIKRQVALKILKPGMDSKRVVARFEAERQALALLDHPNIAHVLEAGSADSGRPYFAMEYIKGLPITDYCDRHQLMIKDRLKLFIQVCEAIQHAHQKGIIHRDIKPSNIIIDNQDGITIPKVIDFGVAKAIGMPLTDKTLFTQQGQLIGTPEYMSPEQADFKERDIDTRSDIYSLGVVLYELVAGVLPFESKTLREAGYTEIHRIIREEEPPRPSSKLSHLGQDATKIAENRHIEFPLLVKSLHNELEWIPLKAIRKDREQRYKTASDMAEDIQNYLDGNPLTAGPESVLYRFKKVLKKYSGIAAAVASAAAILVISLVVITHLYFQSEKSRIAAIESEKAALDAKNHADVLRIKAEGVAEEKRKSAYFDTIAEIYSGLKNAESAEVQRMFEECPEDLRSWEYAYLRTMYERSMMTIPAHEKKPVYWISFTPDGSKIISAGNDNTVRFLDSITGNELQRFPTDPNSTYFDYSQDGRFALAADKNVLTLWDLQKKTSSKVFDGQNQVIRTAVFSKDSKRFAASFGDIGTTIRIWDTHTGQEIQSIHCGRARVFDMDFSPDGTRLASISDELEKIGLQLWNIDSGQLLREVYEYDFSKGFPALFFSDVEFDVTGDYILTAHRDQARVWHTETLQIKTTVPSAGQEGYGRAVFSPDGNAFMTMTMGLLNPIKIWDVVTGRCIRTLQIPSSAISCFAYSPDGARIAEGDFDGVIKVWNLADQQDIIEIELPDAGAIPRLLSLNPDGTLLAFQGNKVGVEGVGRIIQIWDTTELKEIGILEGHTGFISETVFSPDGKSLASSSADSTIRIWNMESNPPITTTILQDQTRVICVQYSPDGNSIVSGGADGIIKIWNPQSREIVRKLEDRCMTLDGQKCAINYLRFTPDGKQILSGGSDKKVRIWDFDTGECLNVFDGHITGLINALEVSPDGNTVASIASSSTGLTETMIWNKETAEPISSLKGTLSHLRDIVFSKDGKRLFCASADGIIQVWDTQTWRCLLTIGGGRDMGNLDDLILSPDGQTIYASISTKSSLLLCSTKSIGEDPRKRISEISCNTYLRKGSAYYDHGRFEDATESLKKAVELSPDNRTAHYTLLKVYHELCYSDSRSLEDIVRMCEQTEWRDWLSLGILATRYARSGDFANAMKWQKEALGHLPPEISSVWRETYHTNLHCFQEHKLSAGINVWSFSDGNLIAHWTFDDCVGNTVVDSSGNGLNGQLTGNAQIINDPERGKVLSLDGKASYVDCGDDWKFDISGAITVSAWLKINKFDTRWHAIVTKGATSWRLQRFIDSESIEFGCTGISNQPWGHLGGVANVNDGQWHHIVGVYDSREISLFVDGRLDVSEKATGHIVVNQSPVYIGSNAAYNRASPYGGDWNGLLDDVRIYSYALRADEIEKLYRDTLISNRK